MPAATLDAPEYLTLVAGEACPCGHLKDDHEAPDPSIPGETMGECKLCDCRGIIDLWSTTA